jgi:transaldolase
MSTATLNRTDSELREAALTALASVPEAAPSDKGMARLRELGTQLWLDTGNLEEAQGLWRREFGALTTNNTLANQVVQSGAMDDAARAAVSVIRADNPGISEDELVMELGFVVNCRIALRLVDAFDVHVSVELHPSVAEDMDRTVEYARRYFAVCPERFIIKIPLTPEGYCAVARVRAQNIPVNYTLGFGARQNVLAARISNPTWCNVFLGRLNAVIVDNGLGSGTNMGERAAQACQMALRKLRAEGRTGTAMIAASMRNAGQIVALAGADVFTMPPKAAAEFMNMGVDPASLTDLSQRTFETQVSAEAASAVEDLWSLPTSFTEMADALAARGGTNLTADDLRTADRDFGVGLFHSWTEEEQAVIRSDGKIPVWTKWAHTGVALDDLMTQSALQSFTVDQAALDARLRSIIAAA